MREPKGSTSEIKAEVPMSELLKYALDLRSLTAGRGDYTMELARYELIPTQIAKKIADSSNMDDERVGAR